MGYDAHWLRDTFAPQLKVISGANVSELILLTQPQRQLAPLSKPTTSVADSRLLLTFLIS